MSEFEFLAVLLSIVFGLALTQLLSGAVRLFYEDRIDDVHLAWALVVALSLIINWWGFFEWSDAREWRFELYAFLMIWATAHYAMAGTSHDFENHGDEECGFISINAPAGFENSMPQIVGWMKENPVGDVDDA